MTGNFPSCLTHLDQHIVPSVDNGRLIMIEEDDVERSEWFVYAAQQWIMSLCVLYFNTGHDRPASINSCVNLATNPTVKASTGLQLYQSKS